MTFTCAAGQLTLKSNTIHGERSGQLGRNFHAATDQGLPEHVLEGFVEVGAVAQFADHRDRVLIGQEHSMNARVSQPAVSTHSYDLSVA